MISISEEIVKGNNYIKAAVNGALKSLDIIEEALKNGELTIPEIEIPWLSTIRADLELIPSGESEFTEMMLPQLDSSKIILSEYGL